MIEEDVLATAIPQRTIGFDLIEAASLDAPAFGVSSIIHPNDFIFWYIHDDAELANKSEAPSRYFKSGKDTVGLISHLLAEYGVQLALARRPNPEKRVSLLEFASGYGRVTRHFPVVMPEFDVVACDIHDGAVGFLNELGLPAVQSSSLPESLDTGRLFNVVFAFSFFTHMPRSTWSRWLSALVRQLEPNGLLIFTAHGEVTQPLMGVGTLERDGFFFHTHSEQKDLDSADYGNTITTFEFVVRELLKQNLKVIQFRQAGAGHHDVYIVQNAPSAKTYVDLESEKLSDANDRLQAEVQALKASNSWRFTAPIRGISSRFYKR